MLLIGLTGGIGSGKSTVSSYLKDKGFSVFDADASSRNAVKKGSKCLEEIRALLGDRCIRKDGELDRAWVADKVFSDAALRARFQVIVQKRVLDEARDFAARRQKAGDAAVFWDVPLLIECGWDRYTDLVWLVSVDEKTQIQRAAKRDGTSEAAVKKRIAAQMGLEEKRRHADFVIDNSGSLEETRRQIDIELGRLDIAKEQG